MKTIKELIETKTYFDNIYKNKSINIIQFIKGFSFDYNELGDSGNKIQNNQDNERTKNENEISYLNNKNIIKIESGGSHNLALSNEGKIYAWGKNIFGQLGLDENDEIYDFEKISTPILIKSLENIKIKIISCGEIHSLALSENGDIYSWGGCQFGQLGHSFINIMPKDKNNKPYLPIPSIVESIKEIKMIDIACGKFHNISIDNNGNVYSWGDAQYGQLGIKNIFSLQKNEEGHYYQPIPYKLKELKKNNIYIMKASCGDEHSILLSTEGKIYSFGSNNYGQLGLGNSNNLNINDDISFLDIPLQVKGIIENKIITYISCGNYFTMVIDNENFLYGWGLCQLKISDKIIPKNNNLNNNYSLILSPILINNKRFGKVEKVWCGNFSWTAINEDGVPFGNSLINNENASLKEENINLFIPILNQNLIKYDINNISFGNNFYIVSENMLNYISLKKYIYYNFKENIYTDITLVYKEHKIKCHKFILIISSEYFSDNIKNDTKEININSNEINVEYYLFLTIIQYTYLKITTFIYQCNNLEELINYSQIVKFLGINELIFPIQNKIRQIIQNQQYINLKALNILNCNNNLNSNIQKRTLIGLDGTIYFLLNDNITNIIKENSIQIKKNNENCEYENNKNYVIKNINDNFDLEKKGLNCINNYIEKNNKNEKDELLLSSQVYKNLNKKKKLEKNNDLDYLLNNLNEENLFKKKIIKLSIYNHSYKYIKYINNKNISDLIISIGNYKFYVNKLLLISNSEFFFDLLNNKLNEKEITLNNYSPYKIFIVILFLYLYEYYIFTFDTLLELLLCFYLFKFKSEFKVYIEEQLKKYINVKNVCAIFNVSKRTNSYKLQKICLFFIKENYEEISKSEEFEDIKKENILEINKFCEE